MTRTLTQKEEGKPCQDGRLSDACDADRMNLSSDGKASSNREEDLKPKPPDLGPPKLKPIESHSLSTQRSYVSWCPLAISSST